LWPITSRYPTLVPVVSPGLRQTASAFTIRTNETPAWSAIILPAHGRPAGRRLCLIISTSVRHRKGRGRWAHAAVQHEPWPKRRCQWRGIALGCSRPQVRGSLLRSHKKKLLTGKRVFGQTAMENIAVCRNLDHGAGNSACRNLKSKRLARHITPCMATWSRFL